MRYLLLLLLLTGAVQARPRVLLLTPGLQAGSLEARTLLQVLEHAVEQRGKVNLVHPHEEDPRLGDLPRTQVPGSAQALQAAQRFQADYVVTLQLRFEHKVEAGILTVVGVSLVSVDAAQTRQRSLSDPVVYHSAPVKEPLQAQTQELTVQCARDLAEAILKVVRG